MVAVVSKAAVSAVSAAAVGGGVGYHRVLAADKAVGEEKGENAAHAYCMALEQWKKNLLSYKGW